jgi:hypothetical protein
MDKDEDDETLQAALELLKYGLIPVPSHIAVLSPNGYFCSCGRLNCKGKHPALKTWAQWQHKRPDAAQCRQWWLREFIGYNLGAVHGECANTIAIDADGDEGAESVRELEQELGSLPDTPQQITGGGGLQYIYQYPTGYDIIPTVRGVRPGFDIRGTGGFSVMPPSIHVSSRNYIWECDHHIEDIPIANLPKAWADFLSTSTNGPPTYAPPVPILSGGKQGKIIDGREAVMSNCVYKTFMRLYNETGLVDENVLTQTAWDDYSVQVDLTKPGRGYTELVSKCHAIMRRRNMTFPLREPPFTRR